MSAQVLLAAVAATPARDPEKLPHPQLHHVRVPIIYFFFFNVGVQLSHALLFSKFRHGAVKGKK